MFITKANGLNYAKPLVIEPTHITDGQKLFSKACCKKANKSLAEKNLNYHEIKVFYAVPRYLHYESLCIT